MGRQVRARHMDWFHLPIPDVSVPDAAFEQQWAVISPDLMHRLRAGFDVLVHCKGGLGRAGTIATRLMIGMGMAPEVAVKAVRAARPGAIETSAQLTHVLAQAAMPEPVPDTSAAAIRDRAIGALIGLAVGDAVGTTLEFKARDTYPALTDMIGGGPFGLKPGQWTDDTAMALALADSLAQDAALDEKDLMQRFVDWHANGTYSCTGHCFDIGITTRQALARWQKTSDPFAGSTDPMSAGNGSLMRLSPVAIRHFDNRKTLRDVAARESPKSFAIAMKGTRARSPPSWPDPGAERPAPKSAHRAMSRIHWRLHSGAWRGPAPTGGRFCWLPISVRTPTPPGPSRASWRVRCMVQRGFRPIGWRSLCGATD
jgi:ADP-ribosyl-[dinitrogen reductase] hydrolase